MVRAAQIKVPRGTVRLVVDVEQTNKSTDERLINGEECKVSISKENEGSCRLAGKTNSHRNDTDPKYSTGIDLHAKIGFQSVQVLASVIWQM